MKYCYNIFLPAPLVTEMRRKLTSDEEIIINESSEISVGERPWWSSKLYTAFPAFESRNFRLYFFGQFISLIGLWLQIVAQGWLVLQLTNSAFLVGLVAAVGALPTLLFTLFGGVIVDSFSKKKIILFTQSAAAVLAFFLGILTVNGLITIPLIMIIAFLLGVVGAIDSPARQSFVIELVGKEKLSSAIALNSGNYNSARVIGPSIAGFLIAFTGVGGAFIINAISYIAVIVALLSIQEQSFVSISKHKPLKAIREGIVYSTKHPMVRTLLIFSGVTSIFGWGYTTIMPVIARNTFHTDASGLGYLFAASGLGAFTASILVSTLGRKVSPIKFILGGSFLFTTALISFSFTDQFLLALVFLFLAGFGILTQYSMMNTTIQDVIDNKYRGRVMSIYTIMFLGMLPFGNLQIGYLSQHLGTSFAICFGAIIVGLFSIYFYFNRNQIREAHNQYMSQRTVT